MMSTFVKIVISLGLAMTLVPYIIFIYEKLNLGEKLSFWDVVKAMLFEFFSIVYLLVSWLFGFLPIEEWVIGRGEKKTPVVLVPGCLQTRAILFPLFFRLRRAGFENVYPITLRPFFGSIEEIKKELEVKVSKILETLGKERVILIGFSLGGIVTRFYTEENSEKVIKCITIGTPHKGMKIAAFGFSMNLKQVRTGSEFLEKLPASPEKYTCVFSKYDEAVVPSEHAVIQGAEVIEADNIGHFTMVLSPRLSAKIVEKLRAL